VVKSSGKFKQAEGRGSFFQKVVYREMGVIEKGREDLRKNCAG